MMARDFASPVRGVDSGFVARQRARGTPEAAIARMGGWCLADVAAVPRDPVAYAIPRPAPLPEAAETLVASEVPDVAEILAHIAEQYAIAPADILGPSHSQEYVEPRHEAFAVVNELNRYTLKDMAGLFNKTPNAIIYGLRRHYERLRFRGPGRDW